MFLVIVPPSGSNACLVFDTHSSNSLSPLSSAIALETSIIYCINPNFSSKTHPVSSHCQRTNSQVSKNNCYTTRPSYTASCNQRLHWQIILHRSTLLTELANFNIRHSTHTVRLLKQLLWKRSCNLYLH